MRSRMAIALRLLLTILMIASFGNAHISAHNITRVGELLIDTDAGSDDAMAIVMALEAERLGEGLKVVGITCVNGNTDLDNVVINVLKTIKVVDRLDVPVYRGAQHPLTLRDEKIYFFGKDGFGDFEYPDAPSLGLIKDAHAVDAMIELVKANPGEVTLLALGPLTNIALAIRLYPSFLVDLQQLIVMGGCVEGSEGIRPGVEFNFDVDPVANYIVFSSSQTKPTVILPCETNHRTNLSMDFRRSLGTSNSSKMWLLNSAEYPTLRRLARSYWYSPDQVTAAVALTSGQIVTRSNSYYAEAIFEGPITRGMILLDYTARLKRPVNALVVQDINVDAYKELLLKYLG